MILASPELLRPENTIATTRPTTIVLSNALPAATQRERLISTEIPSLESIAIEQLPSLNNINTIPDIQSLIQTPEQFEHEQTLAQIKREATRRAEADRFREELGADLDESLLRSRRQRMAEEYAESQQKAGEEEAAEAQRQAIFQRNALRKLQMEGSSGRAFGRMPRFGRVSPSFQATPKWPWGR